VSAVCKGQASSDYNKSGDLTSISECKSGILSHHTSLIVCAYFGILVITYFSEKHIKGSNIAKLCYFLLVKAIYLQKS